MYMENHDYIVSTSISSYHDCMLSRFPCTLYTLYIHVCKVEPLNNGQIGTSHFVHCREVVLSSVVLPYSIGASKVWRILCLLSEVPLYMTSL